MERTRTLRILGGFWLLLLLLFVFILWNIFAGSVSLSASEIWRILLGGDVGFTQSQIIVKIRLPRLLSALILGGALSLSGYLLQTFFHNPIAGPFVLGISSGAKMTVCVAMLALLSRGKTTSSAILIAAAFVGAMVSMGFVLLISQRVKRMSLLVVCGVMAAVICLIFLSSSIFISNVVAPVSAVSEAAKRISGGSYGIQIPNKYTDEMGVLVDNINDMSLKISQSEKMESEFISSVSHELRTPLTAINGWGETLLEDESCDVQQLRRGVQIILKESRRLTNMVEELLDFSKMTDGRFTLQVEDTDLQAELEDAVYTYRELFRQDGISLEYTSDKALYEEPITGDPERLKQVFCNVLDNAAKHGGSGKRIVVLLTKENEAYGITIRDFGPGIPAAELPYVKQKFYKGSSRARGSGIGLAVCDEIVNLHGGRFDIGNAEGGGTVVTIHLPLKRETEKEL